MNPRTRYDVAGSLERSRQHPQRLRARSHDKGTPALRVSSCHMRVSGPRGDHPGNACHPEGEHGRTIERIGPLCRQEHHRSNKGGGQRDARELGSAASDMRGVIQARRPEHRKRDGRERRQLEHVRYRNAQRQHVAGGLRPCRKAVCGREDHRGREKYCVSRCHNPHGGDRAPDRDRRSRGHGLSLRGAARPKRSSRVTGFPRAVRGGAGSGITGSCCLRS